MTATIAQLEERAKWSSGFMLASMMFGMAFGIVGGLLGSQQLIVVAIILFIIAFICFKITGIYVDQLGEK